MAFAQFVLGLFIIVPLLVCLAAGPAMIFTALFRWIMRPLAVPDRFKLLQTREWMLTIIVFLSLVLFYLGIGALILVVTYAIGVIRHFRRRYRVAQGIEAPELTPILPRFCISDMLAMVFSLGVAPLLYQAIETAFEHQQSAAQQEQNIFVFAVALVTFPACFTCALYRLDSNGVPPSLPRVILVGMSPYLALACVLAIPIWAATLVVYSDTHPQSPGIVFLLAGLFAVLILGRYFANAARNRIERPAAV